MRVLMLSPVWQCADLLPRWLAMLEGLDPQPEEFVWAENNSTDATLPMLSSSSLPHHLLRVWFKEDPIAAGENPYVVIAHIRQLLLSYARHRECDFAVFLDSDIFVRSPDVLDTLPHWGVDIVGGAYYRHFSTTVGRQKALATIWDESGRQLKTDTTLPLHEVFATSAGCLCLSRRILQDRRLNFFPIHTRVDAPRPSEDFAYCMHARELGYGVFLDSLVWLDHVMLRGRPLRPWTMVNGVYVPFRYGGGD